MRILMLSTLGFHRTIGGVESHTLNLSRSLLQLGHHVEIVVPVVEESPTKTRFELESFVNQISYQDITIHEIYLKGFSRHLKRLRDQFAGRSQVGMLIAFLHKASYQLESRMVASIVLGLLQDRQMEVLHQHDFSANILTTKLVSRHFPVVLTNHTGEFLFIKSRWYSRPLLRFALSHYRRVIGPSPELADTPYFTDKAVYIPNGVDTEFFSPVSESIRNKMRYQLGYTPEDFIVLCPRRWAPTKGVIYLCKAIQSVIGKIPNAVFLFAGSDYQGYPGYRREILETLRNLECAGIADFQLLGDLDAERLRSFYQISDAVVIPSLMEATSLAALEAMATACPVVATGVGGMPEIVEHGVTGFLVEPADPAVIEKALLEIWHLGNRRKDMGQAAREFVLKDYQWQKIAEATANVYGEALAECEEAKECRAA